MVFQDDALALTQSGGNETRTLILTLNAGKLREQPSQQDDELKA